MKLLDWIIILILFFTLVFALIIYYQKTTDLCSSNPLVFASREYEKSTGYEFEGLGWFKVNGSLKNAQIYFNSTGIFFLPE